MLDRWDDLKFLLAVARAGSLTAAAKRLHVDQTTVTRRIKALEGSIGSPLFERSREGLVLTAAGEVLRMCAEGWEAHLHDASRRLEGGVEEASGPVRIALPELFALPLVPELTQYAHEHPELTLEVVVSDGFSNIHRREADLAVRVTAHPPEHLIARRVGSLATAIYAAPTWSDTPLDRVPWVGWDRVEAPDSQIEQARQLHGPTAPYAMLVNSYGMLVEAVRNGAGATFLPCLAGDRLMGLGRRTEPVLHPRSVWLLTHPELRRSARVSAVREFLVGVFDAHRASLEGASRRS